MRELITKQDQFRATMFGGRFHANKPVVGGRDPSGRPSAALFYWSHAITTGDCEFGLHAHEGFEIMTFVLDGENAHYDTTTRTWTSLRKGDFQVIQSGSGVSHAERIAKGTRAFQIWFDPDVERAMREAPAYRDLTSRDVPAVVEQDVTITEYVGGGSKVRPATAGLTIRKVAFSQAGGYTLPLGDGKRSMVYVVAGRARLDSLPASVDDVMIASEGVVRVEHEPGCDLFVVEVPSSPDYVPLVALDGRRS
jgi:redox-sensitive bicupin YhaK (pirin superfamily)